MRIVSWNVNGIRATWAHGLANLLRDQDADIFAFQETKVSEPFTPVEQEGYYPYWSFCQYPKGYSGTLCLSKVQPIDVTYDLIPPTERNRPHPPFDYQGRVITMEFKQYFFVNCYTPNSTRGMERSDYRVAWDARFNAYIHALSRIKPVILCGDMNVTASDRDIYPDHQSQDEPEIGFQDTERESFLNLLDSGFADAYRVIHPDEDGNYTWWSSRLNKRAENKGWRLDYFLVSESIEKRILESHMLTDVYGSDHCPIYLDIDMPDVIPPSEEAKQLSDTIQRIPTSNAFLNALRSTNLTTMWQSIDWDQVEKDVAVLQYNLAKQAYTRNSERIVSAQKQIAFSLNAKLLAVRHVCSSDSGPGIDGITWTTPHDKMLAALSLSSKGYRAMPARMILVQSKNGKIRRIRIMTCYDRAMQSLYAMTLDPVSESLADKKSFAFRKGRSMLDLCDYICQAFSQIAYYRKDGTPVIDPNPPEWAFICDIHQCYESISQDWLLKNIPMEKHVLTEFLRAGYFFQGELFPSDVGFGLGLTLSPILANMTLDGLQRAIFEELYPDQPIDYRNGNLIRYSDDILVVARTKKDALRISEIVRSFVQLRGLELSEDKSRIVNINDGFEFMSRRYFKNGGIIHVEPSVHAINRFKHDLEETVMNHTGSQQALIAKLNKKLDGWATYHKISLAAAAFRTIDTHLSALLLDLSMKKHPKWSVDKIRDYYWYQRGDGKWIYALPDKKETAVRLLSDVILVGHISCRLSANPYIDIEYLQSRSEMRTINNATGIYRSIWNRQEGRCYLCGRMILQDQERVLIPVDGAARSRSQRYAYVHPSCGYCSVDYIDTDTFPSTDAETMELLKSIQRNIQPSGQKFLPLAEYFRKCTRSSLTLTFDEIEKILGQPLGRAQYQRTYWHRTGFMCISQSWLEHGYEIKKLEIDHRRISFVQTQKGTSALKIPEVFLTQRIPNEAKFELENYFVHIKKKYGL